MSPGRKLIPWALVTLLALCAAGTVAFTEARKTLPSPAALKLALLSPSLSSGRGGSWWGVRAVTFSDTLKDAPRCFRTGPAFGGPISQVVLTKNAHDVRSSLEETIMQPSAGAREVFTTLVRCSTPKTQSGPQPRGGHQAFRLVSSSTTAFGGIGQASAGVTSSLGDPLHHSAISWFVQGDDLVAIAYLGPASLSQIRQWAAATVEKAAANT